MFLLNRHRTPKDTRTNTLCPYSPLFRATRNRDEKKRRAYVASMRKRMAEYARAGGPWDLKQQRGVLVDLEFIVQYLLLRHGAAAPQILHRDRKSTRLNSSH